MVNVVGSKDNYDRMKPPQFKNYLTMAELCDIVKRDRRRIVQLEQKHRIPAPIRVKLGRHHVRLYSPDEVATIVRYFKTAKPGRPKGGSHAKD